MPIQKIGTRGMVILVDKKLFKIYSKNGLHLPYTIKETSNGYWDFEISTFLLCVEFKIFDYQ